MTDFSGTSTLEVRIRKFLSQYGPEQMISWLDEFDYSCGPNQFKQFKLLERITCDAFGITISDMRMLLKDECVNAKRVITFIALNEIRIGKGIVQKLLGGVSLRSVNYYIKDAEEWIREPKRNRPFFDGYTRVIEKFNIKRDDKN